MRLAVISPHPDDMALSIGGLMGRIATADVLLITCFSQSCWSALSDCEDFSKLRAMEDDAYAADLGVNIVRLNFPDTNVRSHVGRWSLRQTEEAVLRAQLREQLEETVKRWNASATFVPLGVGGHQDHLHCREAAVDSLPADALVFYEDLPYADMEGGPTSAARVAAERLPDCREWIAPLGADELRRKVKRLSHYRSQIAAPWVEAVQRYAADITNADGYGERYWSLPLTAEISSVLHGGLR
jgi:LmbE family N-acetylglucosaminyl deacetylase